MAGGHTSNVVSLGPCIIKRILVYFTLKRSVLFLGITKKCSVNYAQIGLQHKVLDPVL